MFSFFKRKSSNRQVVARLYHSIAAASLRPELFSELAVADTLEGRFEILALHMTVVLRHMRDWPAPADEVASDLTDYYFEQLDDVLREIGISDNKVPKKMKGMAGAYLMRAKTYDRAIDATDDGAMQALLTQHFGLQVDAAGLAHYVFAIDRHMNEVTLDALLDKGVVFPVLLRPIGEVS